MSHDEFRAVVWAMLDEAYAVAVAESQDRLIRGDETGQPLGILTTATMAAVIDPPWTCRRGVWKRW
jgi:hypothetical protein